MEVENTMIDDNVFSTPHSASLNRRMVRCSDGGEVEEPIEVVNAIVDDSSDDDLIEVGESQCIKQVINNINYLDVVYGIRVTFIVLRIFKYEFI